MRACVRGWGSVKCVLSVTAPVRAAPSLSPQVATSEQHDALSDATPAMLQATPTHVAAPALLLATYPSPQSASLTAVLPAPTPLVMQPV